LGNRGVTIKYKIEQTEQLVDTCWSIVDAMTASMTIRLNFQFPQKKINNLNFK